MISRFERQSNNWYVMSPERTDDSFYFNKNDFGNVNVENGIRPEWFRVLLYSLKDEYVAGFKTALQNKGLCLFHLGIEYDRSVPFFKPFLQVTSSTPISYPIDGTDCFDLAAENHLASENLQADPYLFIDKKTYNNPGLGSSSVSGRFVKQLQDNWLISSPKETVDHFKVIELKEARSQQISHQVPTVEVVRYYIFTTRDNLQERVKDVTAVQVSLGLNLNTPTGYPKFAPILILKLSGDNNSEQYFEELADPCPPTCGID